MKNGDIVSFRHMNGPDFVVVNDAPVTSVLVSGKPERPGYFEDHPLRDHVTIMWLDEAKHICTETVPVCALHKFEY